MTILATIVVLAVLIFVHELGHFLAAKSVGIEVQRFSIGLGPTIFGFQKGETEYVISWIPLGGYVKMLGQEDIDPAARGGTKLGQLMKALERLQVPPADRISIVKDLHKHGSLHAQLIIE